MSDIIWFSNCSYDNKNLVGGKNASLGELYNLSQIMGVDRNLIVKDKDNFRLKKIVLGKFLEKKFIQMIMVFVFQTKILNIL